MEEEELGVVVLTCPSISLPPELKLIEKLKWGRRDLLVVLVYHN